ncbi:argininosuccinate lyase [Streptomyces hygroscopicus]|uniref:argininosuccinate lyase n=1 Tax=Streptomyces hygroscopicus TaxID=1912 RepID=UPI00068EA1D5|nr:lyase family protein [Streptomyces hygroscopicus]
MAVTGRIDGIPHDVWHAEVLAPQFTYEVKHLLGHYLAIEKVLLLEYVRMDLVGAADAAALGTRLDTLGPDAVHADPEQNMSDISFAVERHVQTGDTPPFPAWHVDRSRNDAQACAQLMAAREDLAAVADDLTAFARAVLDLAGRYTDTPMPGYTHGQAAQIISPGFHLAALAAETTGALRRMLHTYDECDACPLGAGTMAGQELPWDRARMADLLGFARPQPHALVAVASRTWTTLIAGDLAHYAVVLSRFTTDLMTWTGSGFGFLDLPDELAGISAAMPQKRNFPVLERIRGRCAHVVGRATDIAAGQRNTPYTNTVEVSKETGGQLRVQVDSMRSVLRLAHAVVAGATFRTDRMRAACAEDHLGGFTLANRLTLGQGIPWRTAQIIAGRYVRHAVRKGLTSGEPDAALLRDCAAESGCDLDGTGDIGDIGDLLTAAFDVDRGLRAKRSAGSAHPDRVRDLLAGQDTELDVLGAAWAERAARRAQATGRHGALLTGLGQRSS